VEVLVDADIDSSQSRNEEGYQNRIQADTGFKVSIEFKWLLIPVYQSSEIETAEGQSTHEGSQYRGGGKGSTAEHQGQHPLPDNLVDKSGGPGKEEEYEYSSLNTLCLVHRLHIS